MVSRAQQRGRSPRHRAHARRPPGRAHRARWGDRRPGPRLPGLARRRGPAHLGARGRPGHRPNLDRRAARACATSRTWPHSPPSAATPPSGPHTSASAPAAPRPRPPSSPPRTSCSPSSTPSSVTLAHGKPLDPQDSHSALDGRPGPGPGTSLHQRLDQPWAAQMASTSARTRPERERVHPRGAPRDPPWAGRAGRAWTSSRGGSGRGAPPGASTRCSGRAAARAAAASRGHCRLRGDAGRAARRMPLPPASARPPRPTARRLTARR